MVDWKHRSTEDARKALSNFCKAVGTHGDHSVHIFTVPVDNDRDADMVLSDVITERDQLLAEVDRLRSQADAKNDLRSALSKSDLKVSEMTEALNKIHDLAGQTSRTL